MDPAQKMEPQILVMSSNLIIWGLMMPSIPFASKQNGEFSYTDSQNALATNFTGVKLKILHEFYRCKIVFYRCKIVFYINFTGVKYKRIFHFTVNLL